MTMPPFWQSVNLWWPDDRAWFVSTEIDLAWTYIGGSQALIDMLLNDEVLEVLPAELHHDVSHDQVNSLSGEASDPED